MAKRPEENTINDFAPQLRPLLEESLEGMDFLQQLTQEDAARIPEPLFVEHLLPILANRNGRQSLVRWQQVAGHVMRPLDIVDPKTGEVLFRVPALLRQLRDTVKTRNNRSTHDIAAIAEKKRQVMPVMGDNYLQAHLTDRVQSTPANVKEALQWNSILVRYGYPSLFTTITVTNDEQEIDEGHEDDTLDIEGFDDL